MHMCTSALCIKPWKQQSVGILGSFMLLSQIPQQEELVVESDLSLQVLITVVH